MSDKIQKITKNEDLEEEINRVEDWYPVEIQYIREIASHFAEWQKQQMVKDAVDAIVVVGSDGKLFAVPILIRLDEEIRNKKKVKLIIIDKNE